MSVGSVLRALVCVVLAAVTVATAHAAFVVRTEYESWWISAIVGAAVGFTLRVSRPGVGRLWMWAMAAPTTLLSLLLSDYLIGHYGGLAGVTDDTSELLLWGVSIVVACQTAGDADGDGNESEVSENADPGPSGRTVMVAGNDLTDGGTTASAEPTLHPGEGAPGLETPPPTNGFGDPRPTPEPNPQSESQRPLHAAGVILGVSVLAIAVGVVSMGLLRGSSFYASGQIFYQDLQVADCVRDMQSDSVYMVEVVDCGTEAHTDEVFAKFTLPQRSWPGEKAVEQLAWSGCDARFEQYVGVSAEETYLDEYMVSPDKRTWPDDRLVVCSVSEGSGSHLGSLRNANR